MTTNVVPTDTTPGRGATRPAIAMFALLLLAYSVNAMDRMVFPMLLPEVRSEYGFSLDQSGLQATVFALGMGITGIPAGIALARFGRKPLIVVGTVAFSVATIMTIASAGFADMLVWRVLSGVGEALQLAAIITVAAGAFPRHRGLAIGAVNMAFATGSVVGPTAAAALLVEHGTWRSPMIVFGALGLVLAVAVMIFVPRRFTEAAGGAPTQSRYVGGVRSLVSWNPLLLAVITVLFGLADFAYIGLYPTYLRENLGFTPGQAGLAVGLAGLAAFASPLGGLLTDRLDPRACLGLVSLLTAAAASALFLGPPTPGWHAAFSFLFGLFASSGVYVVLASLLVKSVHPDIVGHASGLFITCIYVAAGIAGYVFSRIVGAVDWVGAGLVQIAGFSLAGALLALLLRPSLFSTAVPTESEIR
ncbi:Predicted arabinose efflux permease, MFS family [Micromonospora inyonensis]|uniref:Predicted arabinose efflux permease, MFS family n=2 Tax=Micromonospora inyonensis TaxID=47866 RepID=A0A1C6S8J6_9ACTN|nr:Predicted arabinose efflux permease, MFS family [Micromonospora inyonensis]